MSKIEELEQKIIKQGMTLDDFEEYKRLLRRVRGNFLKRQHCYTTAIQFSPQHEKQAIMLIKYGLETFEDSWFSTYTSYLFIGEIYEKSGNYHNAYDSYLLAMSTLDNHQQSYKEELSMKLLWMKLHIDDFQYSKELEEYYCCYIKTNDFSKRFINNELRSAIAETVISLHYHQYDKARMAYNHALKIYQPGYISQLQNILNKHHYIDSLRMTQESLVFLKNLRL